jgi:uncharacterized protein (DUF4415 family)
MRVTKREAKEIQALKRLRDEEIDLTDIPPLKNWDKAVIGRFYRPLKKSLTIRIDADLLARLRAGGKGYQTRINALLRRALDSPDRSAIRFQLTEFGLWPRRGHRHGH